MRFADLEPFDIINIGGPDLEIQYVSDSGRIAVCRVLDAEGNYIPSTSEYERSGFVTTVITDLRYEEVQRKELLKLFT